MDRVYTVFGITKPKPYFSWHWEEPVQPPYDYTYHYVAAAVSAAVIIPILVWLIAKIPFATIRPFKWLRRERRHVEIEEVEEEEAPVNIPVRDGLGRPRSPMPPREAEED